MGLELEIIKKIDVGREEEFPPLSGAKIVSVLSTRMSQLQTLS